MGVELIIESLPQCQALQQYLINNYHSHKTTLIKTSKTFIKRHSNKDSKTFIKRMKPNHSDKHSNTIMEIKNKY